MNIKNKAINLKDRNLKTVTLICKECDKDFEKSKSQVLSELNNPRGRCKFCSIACFNKHQSKELDLKCCHCNKAFKRKPSEIKRSKNLFCSQSCAAIFNNGKFPKRIKKEKIKKIRFKEDDKQRKVPVSEIDNITKEELFIKRTTWQSARSTIQKHARNRLIVSGIKQECKLCGYSNHVECCHIYPVSMFLPTDTVDKINSLDNLIYLCPNHHWEFDNGVLTIEEIEQQNGTKQIKVPIN